MCGISCLVQIGPPRDTTTQAPSPGDVEQQIERGITAIAHRGPDGRGCWVSRDGRVGLGHCRLAIIGPDERGLQPLSDSVDARAKKVHIVVNGEFYGHEDLKRTLCADYTFTTNSDSEVLLALYLKFGLEESLKHLRGEFAFVLYDEEKGKLYAVRDRFGVKPLYFGYTPLGQLALCSEIKGLLAMGCQPKWDLFRAVNEGWRIDNGTLLQNIKWLKVGWLIEVDCDAPAVEERCWYIPNFPSKTITDGRPEDALIEGVRSRLIDAVRVRLRSDVPVGVYLSGGVDSSSIAGIVSHLLKTGMAPSGANLSEHFKCFTIGFDHEGSELPIAKRTAEFVGAEFCPLEVTEALLCDHFEQTILQCELPYGDLGTVAKYLLSEHAKKNGVTVVLTGEGSDEHLAGYPFFKYDRYAEPDLTTSGGQESPPDTFFPPMRSFWGKAGDDFTAEERKTIPAARYALTKILAISHHHNGLADWAEQYRDPASAARLLQNMLPADVDARLRADLWHPLNAVLLLWQQTTFPTQLLTHLGDRVEMAHALEARLPFLDHHLVEFIDSLPPAFKLRFDPRQSALREKWVLYEAVKPFVSEEVYARIKQPFLAAKRRTKDGPLYKLLMRHLTRDNVARVGWLDYDRCMDLVEKGYAAESTLGDSKLALAEALLCAEMCIFARHWKMEPLTPEDAKAARSADASLPREQQD
ncbi:unnamed protein product [Parajaminaea phylloscopi]